MTTAQPGQEQRMRLVARLERFHDSLNVNRHYMTGQTCREVQRDIRVLLDELKATRPTADLGEDGELVARLRGFATAMREYKPTLVSAGYGGFAFSPSDYEAITDRLILYREALVAVEHAESVEIAREAARAVLSRSGGSPT